MAESSAGSSTLKRSFQLKLLIRRRKSEVRRFRNSEAICFVLGFPAACILHSWSRNTTET